MVASLNATTFEETLTQCGQHSKYEAVIVLPVLAEVRRFADEIRRVDSLRPIPHLKEVVSNHNYSLMRFKNGSSIEITAPSTMRGGDRYHTVLVDESVDSPEFLSRVHQYEKPYERDVIRDATYMFSTQLYDTSNYTEAPRWQREYSCNWGKATVNMPDPMDDVIDTAELDNFLNGFAVNS